VSPTDVLRDVLVVLVAAKLAAEIAERINVPAVVGEIIAGVLIGPSLLGLVDTSSALEVLAEFGVILLLLQVGMEMDIKDLAAVGKASLSVAVLGVILPMVGGYAVGIALGQDGNTALFLGAALAATSVGITARVFSDLGALTTVEARTVLGAAVADDVLGLVILTIVVKIVSQGTVSIGTIVGTVLLAVGFLVLATVLGGRLGVILFRWIQRNSRSAGTLVVLALAFALAFAELADVAKLAPIVGAFVAGLALSRTESRERIARELTPIGYLFVPVFFLQIGIAADIDRFVAPSVLLDAGLLLLVAIVGKIAASLALSIVRAPGDKLLVGFGMLPRGEVGLIFATIGLAQGVLDADLYASLLVVILVTTLLAPPLLRLRLRAMRGAAREHSVDAMPPSGWLWVDDDVVDLAANPPMEAQTTIALDAALRVSEGARPGPRLLDWLGHGDAVDWDPASTARLVDVLVRGNERGWRFLDTSGVLVRALPEVAAFVERRHRDPGLIDPNQVVRFETVEALQYELRVDRDAADVHRRLASPDRLVLAALVLDLTGERPPTNVVLALTERLGLDEEARGELLALVSDQGLLRGVSSLADGASETSALALASHLVDPERVRALYLLELASGPMEVVARDRLDILFGRVLAAQDGMERDAEPGAFTYRRDEAVALAGLDEEHVADRIRHAPRPYLLSELPERIVAHARLLEPRPDRRELRVVISSRHERGLTIDVVARDQVGLLASVTEVFAAHDLDVLRAQIVTWGDGAALETFVVELRPGSSVPDVATLVPEIRTQLDTRLEVEALPEAHLAFDDAGSPWYTICEVRHPDRPGLLAQIATGLALAGASVHGAELETVDGIAIDRFSLTDRDGNKLGRVQKDAIRAAIREGARARGRLARLAGRR
jgi:Kef-type K+ transport system membrane component KefB/predicted amino acid-binding ACT domain protein